MGNPLFLSLMHGGNKPQEWDWKWLIVVQGQENSAGARAWERERERDSYIPNGLEGTRRAILGSTLMYISQ